MIGVTSSFSFLFLPLSFFIDVLHEVIRLAYDLDYNNNKKARNII
jgi:hypothetical protein